MIISLFRDLGREMKMGLIQVISEILLVLSTNKERKRLILEILMVQRGGFGTDRTFKHFMMTSCLNLTEITLSEEVLIPRFKNSGAC